MNPEQLAAAVEPANDNSKAGRFIKETRTAMQRAMAMAPEMKGRYVRSRRTGNVFGWSPEAEVHPDMETLPADFVPDHVKLHEAEQKAKATGAAQAQAAADALDAMTLDELRDEAKKRDISLGRLKDMDKIKGKIRAWDTLNDGPPADE